MIYLRNIKECVYIDISQYLYKHLKNVYGILYLKNIRDKLCKIYIMYLRYFIITKRAPQLLPPRWCPGGCSSKDVTTPLQTTLWIPKKEALENDVLS